MSHDSSTLFVPFAILIGGGLVGLGVLSLFGVHFFGSKLRGVAAFAAGMLFLVLTEFMFLTSGMSTRFLQGQVTDVADCVLAEEGKLPADRRAEEVLRPAIVACMSKLGYDWAAEQRHCREAPLATNAFCYLPVGGFDRAVVGFQMRFE